MNWRKITELPQDDQLVWIMTYPHKKTHASVEMHCGWVTRREGNRLWFIDNYDETGSGSETWYAYKDFFGDGEEEIPYGVCLSESIMAWIPHDEFVYPPWLEEELK